MSATVVDSPASTPLPPGLPDDVAPLGDRVRGLRVKLAFAAAALAGLLVLGAVIDPRQFYHSYLYAYVFALDICLGALFWVLIHHVSDAGWSVGLRRVYETITLGLYPLGLLFLPVLLGLFSGQLHRWPEFLSGPRPEGSLGRVWDVKAVWFAPPFFLARQGLYFAVWMHYAWWMRRWSLQQDREGGAALTRRMQWWAPSGLIALALTATFFAFDILMSLQYTWFSTIFGVYFWVGGIRGSLSTAVLVVLALRAGGWLTHTITREHLHDAAKLMFGFTIFWAYIGFSQYFLIWYGNVPEETQYYLLRRNGGWYALSIALPILNFVIPFFLLLPRWSKRDYRMLGFVAGWILLMHAYDLYWQVMPVLHMDDVHPHWLDAATLAFHGCVLALAIVWGLQRSPLIPIRDARLNETIGYENETP